VPIDTQVGREPRAVVERAEQLFDEQREPLRVLQPPSSVQHPDALH